MTRTTFIAAAAMLAAMGSAAFADQSLTGTVTVLDRVNNELAIKPAPAGQTTGANAAAEVQKFRMQGSIPDTVHAEDKVTVSYTEANGVKTITSVNAAKD